MSRTNTSSLRDPFEVPEELPEKVHPLMDSEEADDYAPPPPPARTGFIGSVMRTAAIAIPAGGILANSSNMASTAVGVGILGLPNAFNSTGYIVALIYIIVIAMETVYSTWLLAQASNLTGYRTYEQLASGLLFHRADYLLAVIRFVHCLGACIAYVITVGNLLIPIMTDSDEPNPSFWRDEDRGVRVVQALLWLTCMLPLVIPREINSLRYINIIGMISMIYFVIVVIVRSASSDMDGPGVTAAVTGNNAITGISTFIFAFMIQVNSNDIYFELRDRTLFRHAICAASSMTVCSIMYYMVGLFGYLQFGTLLEGSILLQYSPLDQPEVFVAYVGIFIMMCASFGVLGNACRNSMYHVLGWNPFTVAMWKHCIAVSILSLVALFAGLFIPNINTVFNFVGGVCGGSIGFVFPALFRMYAGGWSLREVGIVNWVVTYLTLFGGVVGIVFGTASTIYGEL